MRFGNFIQQHQNRGGVKFHAKREPVSSLAIACRPRPSPPIGGRLDERKQEMVARFSCNARSDDAGRCCGAGNQAHHSPAATVGAPEIRWGGPHFSTKYHSFPSGHVGASTAFFGVLIIARRRVGLVCLPIPILIGFSPGCASGAHYLSDVVCAAVVGLLCALLVAWLLVSGHQTVTINQRTALRR